MASSQSDEAVAAFQSGKAAHGANDFVAARLHFLEAFRLDPQSKYELSVANMALKIGNEKMLAEAKQIYLKLDARADLSDAIRKNVSEKLSDPRLATPRSNSGGADANGGDTAAVAAAAAGPSAAEASRQEELKAKAERAKAELAAARAAAEAEMAKIQAEELAEQVEAAKEAAARNAREKAEAERSARETITAERKKAEMEAKEKLARERKKLEAEIRKQLEAEQKAAAARLEKERLEADAKSKADVAAKAQQSAASVAELTRAAAEKARQDAEARLKQEAEDAKQEAEAQARRLEEELARARASMAASYGDQWGSMSRTNRVVSCSDLGLAIAPAATSSTLTTVREASSDSGAAGGDAGGEGGGDDEQKPKTLRQKSVAKMRSAAGSAGGLVSCRRAALNATREELFEARAKLADVEQSLEEALKQKREIEERGRTLQQKSIEAQEKAAREVAEARAARMGSADGSLLPKLKAAEAQNESLIKQIEELLKAQEVALAAAAAAPAKEKKPSQTEKEQEVKRSPPAPPQTSPRSVAAAAPPARRDSDASDASGWSMTSGISALGGMSSALLGDGGAGQTMTKAEEAQALRLRTKGVLRVHLKGARNLMAADKNGLSDPYVKVSSARVTRTSKTINKTLNPDWNEILELKGSLNDFVTQGLTFKFFDHDKFSFDDPLGDMTVPLDPLRGTDGHTFDNWPLPTQGTVSFAVEWVGTQQGGRKSSIFGRSASRLSHAMSSMPSVGGRTSSFFGKGRNSSRFSAMDSSSAMARSCSDFSNADSGAHIGLSQVPSEAIAAHLGVTTGSGFDVASDSPEATAAAASDPWVRASSKGKLRVLLKSAAGLLSADSNGLSDPYCRVRALANAGHKMDIVTKKSKTIKKTLDPVWNEELSFEGTLQSFLSYGLMIHIVDYDTFSKDDPLGDVWVGLGDLRETDTLEFDNVAVDAPNSELPAQGTLTFRVVWEPARGQVAVAPRQKLEGEARLGSNGILRVHLERGEDLLGSDWTGKSDPYVELRICGTTRKSKKVKGTFKSKQAALNPCWDETVEFHGQLNDFAIDELTLRVKDWDMMKSDDFLGQATVQLDRLRQHDYVHFDEPLSNKDDEPRGAIRFTVHWLMVSAGSTAGGGHPSMCAGASSAGLSTMPSLQPGASAFAGADGGGVAGPALVERPELSVGMKPRAVGKGVVELVPVVPVGRRSMATAVDAAGLHKTWQNRLEEATQAGSDDAPAEGEGRGRSVTLARRVSISQGRKRRNSTISGGRPTGTSHEFLALSERGEWKKRFLQEALMPGAQLHNPFPQQRDMHEVLEAQTPLVNAAEIDPSERGAASAPGAASAASGPSRGAGRRSFVNLPLPHVAPRVGADSSPSDYLAKILYDRKAWQHAIPKSGGADGTERAKGIMPRLHNTLENLKERAMQSSFSLGFSDKDRAWTCSLPKVKKYVVAIWRDTNRLTTLDVHQLLTEMFYHVSQAPSQMKQLGEFWLELLEASAKAPTQCFLDPKRLTLLNFAEVFVGSDALQLAICHYIRSPPDVPSDEQRAEPGFKEKDWDGQRGGLTLNVLARLMRHCLTCADNQLERLKEQIRDMAELVTTMEHEYLTVSSAQMDIHSLSKVFADFVASFKHGAAEPIVSNTTLEQSDRLEKMSLVRQQVQRELTVVLKTYDEVNLSGPGAVFNALGGDGASQSWEADELRCLHELQELLQTKDPKSPMTQLMQTKYVVGTEHLWPCHTLDEIFSMLNAVKARLLGSKCKPIKLPRQPKSAGEKEVPGRSLDVAKQVQRKQHQADDDAMSTTSSGGMRTVFGSRAGSSLKSMRSGSFRHSMMGGGGRQTRTTSSLGHDGTQPGFMLSIEVKQARSLRDGDANVYMKMRLGSYKYETPKVRRNQTARGVEVASFYQIDPFTFGTFLRPVYMDDDAEIELKLIETGWPESTLGTLKVPLASLQSLKEPLVEWKELMKDKRPAGQVLVGIQLQQLHGGGDHVIGGMGAIAETNEVEEEPLAAAADDASDDEDMSLMDDYFTLSGQWRGLFWQSSRDGKGESMQASDLEMIFGPGGELPFPHHKLHGTGQDTLGSYELTRGRRYREANNVEWIKAYTAMHDAYKQPDPDKVRKAEKERAKADGDGAAGDALAAADNYACLPEIFCEGQLDPNSLVISGKWHMNFRMVARCYREPRFDEDEDLDNWKREWRGQRAFPMPISQIMLQLRQPELWSQRVEVLRLIKELKAKKGLGAKDDPLEKFGPGDWSAILNSSTLEGFSDEKQLKLLVQEDARCKTSVKLEPPGQDWLAAEIELKAVHVEGNFVLWQKGLPPHQVFPRLSPLVPHVQLADLIGAEEAKLAPSPASFAEQKQRCLVIELCEVGDLGNFATKEGVVPNLYLVVEIGKQKLICQPQIANQPADDGDDEEEERGFHERFLTFVGEGEDLDALEEGKVELTFRLMNKVLGKVTDELEEQRQSIGGPPYFCSELPNQLAKYAIDELEKRLKKEAADAEKKAEEAEGVVGFLENVFDGMSSVVGAFFDEDEEKEATPKLIAAYPPAPKDTELAHGKLDVTKLVQLKETLLDETVQLDVPMVSLLNMRGMNKHIQTALKQNSAKVLEHYGVDGVANFLKILGFADLEALYASFNVKISDLVQQANLSASKLPVGSLHVRVACVGWGGGDTKVSTSKQASSVVPRTVSISKHVFDSFDGTAGEYDVETQGFLEFEWERKEHHDMKKKVDLLGKAYNAEVQQKEALELIETRLGGRKRELIFALKREKELRMLEGLATFVTTTYERSTVLRETAQREQQAYQLGDVFDAIGVSGKKGGIVQALFKATIPEHDVKSLQLIKAIFSWQLKLMGVWTGGFDRAEQAGQADPEEKRLQGKLKGLENTLGQGGKDMWEMYRRQKYELAALEMEAYTRKDQRHNAMLRRYNGALSVLRSLDEALRSMLPMDYRQGRMVTIITIRYYLNIWRLRDVEQMKAEEAAPSAIESVTQWVSTTFVGRKVQPQAKVAAKITDFKSFSAGDQGQITGIATAHGLVPLAATWYQAKKLQEPKPDAGGAKAAAKPKPETKGSGVFDMVQDLFFRVPYSAAEEEVIEEHRCVKIEQLISQIAEKKQYVEKVVDMHGAMKPREEAKRVFAYHVHVTTVTCPRGDGPSLLGATLMLQHRPAKPDAEIEEREVNLDLQNRFGTFDTIVAPTKGDGDDDEEEDGDDDDDDDDDGKKKKKKAPVVVKGDGGRRLFEDRSTDIFRVVFEDDLGEILGVSLKSPSPYTGGAGEGAVQEWLVDKVTLFRAPMRGAMNDHYNWSYDSTGRSWLFQSRQTHRDANGDDVSAAAVSNHGAYAVLPAQEVCHLVVHVSETADGAEPDDLVVWLHNTRTHLSSSACSLTADRRISVQGSPTRRHYVLSYDNDGKGLHELGDVDGLEVSRAKGGGAPYRLDSMSMWWRSSETLRFFPCYEWLDEEEDPFTHPDGRMRKRLFALTPDALPQQRALWKWNGGMGAAKSDGCVHAGTPPPPPAPPSFGLRKVSASTNAKGEKTPAHQVLTITFHPGEGWGKGLAAGVSWHLQAVPDLEEKRGGGGSGAGGGASSGGGGPSGEWKPGERARASSHGFDKVHRGGSLEIDMSKLKMGGEPIKAGEAYLWRVAARHPAFGEGAFSPPVRVVLEQEDESPTKWEIAEQDEVGSAHEVARGSAQTQYVHAVALGSAVGGKAPPLVPGDQGGVKQMQAVMGGGAAHLRDCAFEDAVKPPGGLTPLLTLVGDAEIGDARDKEGARGALDLTPLRKGVGLVGAAWYHRPLSVRNGFETEFTFKILPPEPTTADGERPRASDGFAFVLQLDQRDEFLDPPIRYDEARPEEKPRVSKAIGASGMQLGYGGIKSCFAVQFCTRPSCASKEINDYKGSDGSGDKDKYLCELVYDPVYDQKTGELDPKASRKGYFYVATKHAGRECIYKWRKEGEDKDRYTTFVAPQLPPERRPKKVDIEESHPRHCDHVSVQCPGVHPRATNTSGPDCCMGTAKIAPLDDRDANDHARQHTARIILERNRFHSPPIPKTEDNEAALQAAAALAQGTPSHRLLVYVDDMQSALINLELNADELFGDTLERTKGGMYAGFTAGTGKTNASHVITSWKFYEIQDSGDSGEPEKKEASDEGEGIGAFFSNLLGL